MGWILTLGLQNLRRQVNAAFPARDTTSDGTIGDAAHQAETSGHNPDDTPGSTPEWDGDPDSTPEVRAWDMDSDLRTPGVTAQQVVDHIRALPGASSVLRYMIYNRKIYKAANGWAPETYTGASAHTEHIHFSGQYTQAADNNTTFDYHLEELIMTPEDVAKAVWEYLLKNYYSGAMQSAASLLGYAPSASGAAAAVDAKLAARFDALGQSLATLAAGVADDATKEQIQAVLDAVGHVDDQVLASLADAGRSDADVAAALRAALGDRAAAVGALLAAA